MGFVINCREIQVTSDGLIHLVDLVMVALGVDRVGAAEEIKHLVKEGGLPEVRCFKRGEDVLVTGAGPIGMMAAAVARHAGARTVVLTDINDFRLELAQKVAPGVRTVNTTREDLKDVMHELGLKVGFDVALEMSGSPIAFKQCVDTLIMGGGMAMLGIPSKPMETDWGAIILKALTIKGVYGREMFTTWRKMLGLLKAGLDLTPLITHQMSYERFEEGFEAMRSGQSGKVVLNWDKAA